MEDERLRALGYRLIYVKTPHILPGDKRRELDLWRSERLTPAGEVPWLTLPNALNHGRPDLAALLQARRKPPGLR